VSRTPAEGSHLEVDALLLLSSTEGSAQKGEIALMLPPGTFVPGRTLAMRAFDRVYALLPRELRERGEGYELVRFRVQSDEL